MKNLIVEDNNLNSVFMSLHNSTKGKLNKDQGEFQLTVNTPKFEGKIKGNCYSNSISYVKCSLHTKQELQFTVQSDHCSSYLYFVFSKKGTLMHRNKSQDTYYPVYQYQTAVISPDTKGLQFLIPKQSNNELIILKIHPELYLKKENFSINRDHCTFGLYDDIDQHKAYAHYGNYNLKICEYFNDIDNQNEQGFVKNIMREARVKLLLAALIKQYRDDLSNRQKVKGLTTSELERIAAVAEHIKINPSAAYPIKKLTRVFGISPSKLQKGFKLLHNRTVADYIKNLRIEVAENMIKNRDCTISEIVYDIGFSSRSYFSKIFKEKYNCCPKQYQEMSRFTSLVY